MRNFLRFLASIVLGFLLLIPLGAIYGAANLAVYHSWGLSHGSFTTALPALSAACYIALGFIPWFGRSKDASLRIVASIAVLPLVTVLFYADQLSSYSLSAWHLGIYAVLFCVLLFLTARSEKPYLLPLFLLMPLLVNPIFGFLVGGGMSEFGIEIFGNELLSNVLPAALASAASIAIARFIRPIAV
jgi:hypothetical protein